MNIQTKNNGQSSRMWKLFAAAALALTTFAGSQVAMAGSIADSKHNLGSGPGMANRNKTDGTAEICVFCHTPHAADTTAKAPLWNKAIPTTSYTVYSSTTMDGTADLRSNGGGVSLACLSCHDGTQAMDNMINAPGSGNYNAAGARLSGTWSGPRVGSGDGLMTGIAKLGGDLSDDHPVGIPYCGGGPTVSNAATACKDPDFATVQKNAGATMFWVDNKEGLGTAAVRDKQDMILYPRSNGALMVECASCHDPHQADNPTFLRIANNSSNVCLSCHVK